MIVAWKNIRLEQDGQIWTLTVDRPEARNALDTQTVLEIHQALDTLDPNQTGVLILTGAGDKAYVSGADIASLRARKKKEALESINGALFTRIENFAWPVIAAVNGFALGGGCELAMACTLRIAADTARFGQPEINLGILPGYGGTQRLPRLVGKGVALDLILTGRQVTASEALAIGLVNRVVPAAELMTEARALATTLAGKAPIAVRYILDAVNRGLEQDLAQGQLLEATLFGLVASTADMREGTRAFVEKRAPRFSGE